MVRHHISEAKTRKELIDTSASSVQRPQLEKASWDVHDDTQVGIEIPVDGYDAEPWNGVTDYILLRENGELLELDAPPDYPALVGRQFVAYITRHNFNADQIRFLTAAQSVFLQKRHLGSSRHFAKLSASPVRATADQLWRRCGR